MYSVANHTALDHFVSACAIEKGGLVLVKVYYYCKVLTLLLNIITPT